MNLSVFSAQHWIFGVGMLFLLALAAKCDANGTEIPDSVTVPYALLGITSAFLEGNILAGLLALITMVFILQPWRPKWLKHVNRWFVRRD